MFRSLGRIVNFFICSGFMKRLFNSEICDSMSDLTSSLSTKSESLCPLLSSSSICSMGSLGTLSGFIPRLSLKITPTSKVTNALQNFLPSPTKNTWEMTGMDFMVSSTTSGATFFPPDRT